MGTSFLITFYTFINVYDPGHYGIYAGIPDIPFLLQILKGHMVFIRIYVKCSQFFLFHSLQGRELQPVQLVHYSFFAYGFTVYAGTGTAFSIAALGCFQ